MASTDKSWHKSLGLTVTQLLVCAGFMCASCYVSGSNVESSTSQVQQKASENDTNTIVWQTYHRPPGIIKTGSNKGKGFVQLILQEVIKEMPGYRHKLTTSTLARALKDMRDGKNVCHPSLMTNPQREKFISFSQSSIFNPANYVITTAETAQQIQPQPIDIAELVSNTQFTFVTIKGRAFGEPVDQYLSLLNEERMVTIASDSLHVMFRLVAMGRIDLTIAYPFEFQYFSQHQTNLKHSMALLPIANMPRFIHGSIGCARTPWGEEVIAQIDKVLTRIKPSRAYRKAMTRWWPESTLDDEFEAYYQTAFLSR